MYGLNIRNEFLSFCCYRRKKRKITKKRNFFLTQENYQMEGKKSTNAYPYHTSCKLKEMGSVEDTCNEEPVCCTQEHDGDDPFYIREFHISMRHYMY